jgi:hypothetical protein
MDKLHLSVLSAWILLIIHDRLIAMTGLDLMVLPFAGLAIVVYALCTCDQKGTQSKKEEA